MPATSKSQQRLMGMALSDPSKVSAKNRGVLSMSKSQLSDFASTKRSKLPMKAAKRRDPGSNIGKTTGTRSRMTP